MLMEANLSTSLIDNMKRGRNPSIDRIYQLAEYLDCSVDYLLGRSNEISLTVTSNNTVTNYNNKVDEQKKKLIDNYEKLNLPAQHNLVDYSDFMTSKSENLKESTDTGKMIS